MNVNRNPPRKDKDKQIGERRKKEKKKKFESSDVGARIVIKNMNGVKWLHLCPFFACVLG